VVFDIVAVPLILLAFAGAVGYCRVCDALTRSDSVPGKAS